MKKENFILLIFLFAVNAFSLANSSHEKCPQWKKTVDLSVVYSTSDLTLQLNLLDSLLMQCNELDSLWLNQLMDVSDRIKDIHVQHPFYWNYFVRLYRQSKYEECFNFSKWIIDHSDENHLLLNGDFYIETGYLQSRIGDYAKQINFFEKAARAYQRDNSENIVYAVGALGDFYIEIEEWDKALKYLEEAYSLALQMKNENIRYYNSANKLMSIGKILAKKGNYVESLEYFKNSIRDSHLQKSTDVVISCYSEFIKVCLENNDLDQAQKLINTTNHWLSSKDVYNSIKKEYHDYYNLMVSRYGLLTNNSKLLSDPEAFLKSSTGNTVKKEMYQYASDYYSKFNQWEKALNFRQKQLELIEDESKKLRVSTAEILQEKEKSTSLAIENYSLKEESRKKQIGQYRLYTLLGLMAIIILWIFTNNNKSKKLNQDITEKNIKITEQIQELERITYVMTHDLKEPANTVNSFAKLITQKYKKDLPTEGKPLFEVIEGTTQGMLNTISNLHSYLLLGVKSKISVVDLDEVLSQVKINLAGIIHSSNAKIIHSTLPTIQGYEEELIKLFQNLVSNAIKYSKQDQSPLVEISFTESSSDYTFSVGDNGIGISKEHQKIIFDLFSRIHSAGNVEGSGIGLANSRKIVQLHRGDIWVESRQGFGSVFSFTLSKNLI